MKYKLSFFIIILVFSLSSCAYFFGVAKISKETYEVWETKNNVFKIKIEAHNEDDGGFVPGAYFIFKSAPINTENWKEIMIFRHDDPIEIRKNQIKFMDEKMAYIFMGWMCAVTTDGGNSWFIWNAKNDLPYWECCNYELIKDIKFLSNSNWIMILSPIENRKGEVPELYTFDSGKHWNK